MSWKRRAEGAYHHGNLREALIQAARELIKEKGPAGFTFADAARSAGVSAAAPYRHFRDRDALIADVALRGFELFTARLEEAWNHGRPDAFRVGRVGGIVVPAARTDENQRHQPAAQDQTADGAGHQRQDAVRAHRNAAHAVPNAISEHSRGDQER